MLTGKTFCSVDEICCDEEERRSFCLLILFCGTGISSNNNGFEGCLISGLDKIVSLTTLTDEDVVIMFALEQDSNGIEFVVANELNF